MATHDSRAGVGILKSTDGGGIWSASSNTYLNANLNHRLIGAVPALSMTGSLQFLEGKSVTNPNDRRILAIAIAGLFGQGSRAQQLEKFLTVPALSAGQNPASQREARSSFWIRVSQVTTSGSMGVSLQDRHTLASMLVNG